MTIPELLESMEHMSAAELRGVADLMAKSFSIPMSTAPDAR